MSMIPYSSKIRRQLSRTRLNTPIAALQNRTLADVFKGPLPTLPELAEFAQHRNVLKGLSTVAVGELERLEAEDRRVIPSA